MATTYKDMILFYLPRLTILDGTEIVKSDKNAYNINQIEDGMNKTQLIFTCHRLIGLPPPPKEVIDKQKVQSYFHIEVKIPLLEEYKLEPEPEVVDPIEEPVKKGKAKGKDKGKNKKGKKSKKGKKGKHGKNVEESPYEANDEHEEELRMRIKNVSFKTDRLPWTKIIQFPEDALRIDVPKIIEEKLTVMRDVFRSLVNVKVIYTQILPPKKKAKKGKDKKAKKGKKPAKEKKSAKDKKSAKGKKPAKENKQQKTMEPEPEPTETIVKKITLASFNCELHNPNWANNTIDYYWCKHEKFPKDKGVEVEGSLKNIIYTEAKKKKKDKDKKKEKKNKKEKKEKKEKGKGKGKKGDKKGGSKGSKTKKIEEPEEEYQIMTKAPAEDVLPDVFTVQIGFALNRQPPFSIRNTTPVNKESSTLQ